MMETNLLARGSKQDNFCSGFTVAGQLKLLNISKVLYLRGDSIPLFGGFVN